MPLSELFFDILNTKARQLAEDAAEYQRLMLARKYRQAFEVLQRIEQLMMDLPSRTVMAREAAKEAASDIPQ